MSNNVIPFKTAPRPLIEGRSKFPYEKVLESLRLLDSTKSLVFPKDELSTYTFQKLQQYAAKVGIGPIRKAVIDEQIFLWVNKV